MPRAGGKREACFSRARHGGTTAKALGGADVAMLFEKTVVAHVSTFETQWRLDCGVIRRPESRHLASANGLDVARNLERWSSAS